MIPVSQPALIGREEEYVTDCVRRVELSFGAYTERFETAFAEFCGVDHALTCSNGTAALHLALMALGVRPGDRVLVPALTYVATANAVRYCGAVPVFCDIDEKTWTISVSHVRHRIDRAQSHGHRVVGMIPVHLFGVPADMLALREIADAYGIWIVEDAAQAHGADINGRTVGSFGELGTFSFYGNKMLTCGEGGMVTTNNADYADRVKRFRGQGVDTSRGAYFHTIIGYNYRLTNVQSALGLAQLDGYAQQREARQRIFAAYKAVLSPKFQVQEGQGPNAAKWMFTVLVPEGVNRDRVIEQLRADGIETRPFFAPIPALPPYASAKVVPPVAAAVSARGICLPTFYELGADIPMICYALEGACL